MVVGVVVIIDYEVVAVVAAEIIQCETRLIAQSEAERNAVAQFRRIFKLTAALHTQRPVQVRMQEVGEFQILGPRLIAVRFKLAECLQRAECFGGDFKIPGGPEQETAKSGDFALIAVIFIRQ